MKSLPFSYRSCFQTSSCLPSEATLYKKEKVHSWQPHPDWTLLTDFFFYLKCHYLMPSASYFTCSILSFWFLSKTFEVCWVWFKLIKVVSRSVLWKHRVSITSYLGNTMYLTWYRTCSSFSVAAEVFSSSVDQ